MEFTKEQLKAINDFRQVFKDGFVGNHLISDVIIALIGTNEEVWKVLKRLLKERNEVREIPEHLKQSDMFQKTTENYETKNK